MFIFLSACSLLVPLSMIILGYTWKDKPPKDRQGSSGYRTTMSRMNDETWRYAHRCWGWINFVLGIILVILSIFILILTKDDTNFEMISVYLVFLQLGIMVLTIMWNELGISGGTAIVILIALYFVIKWAVKNGIKEAYSAITGKKTDEDIQNEKELKELGLDSEDQ